MLAVKTSAYPYTIQERSVYSSTDEIYIPTSTAFLTMKAESIVEWPFLSPLFQSLTDATHKAIPG